MEPRTSALDQLDALLAEGKITDDEYRDLWNALKGPRAETPAEPETPGLIRRLWRFLRHMPPATGRKIGMDIWVVAQIVGLAGIIADHALMCVFSGAASVGLYIACPREKRLIRMVALAAAVIAAIAVGCQIRGDDLQRQFEAAHAREMMARPTTATQPWHIEGWPQPALGMAPVVPQPAPPALFVQPVPSTVPAPAAPTLESTLSQTPDREAAPPQDN